MISGNAGGIDSGQVWRSYFKQSKKFGLYLEDNGKALTGFKQASITIVFAFHNSTKKGLKTKRPLRSHL